jgi:anti-anti-sigma factor
MGAAGLCAAMTLRGAWTEATAMMQLSVRLIPVRDNTLVIALTGELDTTTRPVLAAFLDPLPQSTVRYVIVSAADLWFCDLNGLAQLAGAHRSLHAKGGHLAIAEAGAALSRLIKLTAEHALPAIPLYDSMSEALAHTDGLPSPPPPPLAAAPSAVRHLPRLRAVPHGYGEPRERLPQPRHVSAPVEMPRFEPESLRAVIDQSLSLRQKILCGQQTLTRQLDAARQAQLALAATRERCRGTLSSLRSLRSTLAVGGSAPDVVAATAP